MTTEICSYVYSSLSLSLVLSISLAHFNSLSIALAIASSVSRCISISLSFTLSLSFSLSYSISLSICISLSLYIYISSFSPSRSKPLFFLSIYFSISVLPLPHCLYLSKIEISRLTACRLSARVSTRVALPSEAFVLIFCCYIFCRLFVDAVGELNKFDGIHLLVINIILFFWMSIALCPNFFSNRMSSYVLCFTLWLIELSWAEAEAQIWCTT